MSQTQGAPKMLEGFKITGAVLFATLAALVSPTIAISSAIPSPPESEFHCGYVNAGGAIIIVMKSGPEIGGCSWMATEHDDTVLQKLPILEEYPIAGDAAWLQAGITDDVSIAVPGLLCIDSSNNHYGCDIENAFCGWSDFVPAPDVDYHYSVFVLAHSDTCPGVATMGQITLRVWTLGHP